jgi:hypothetical protein
MGKFIDPFTYNPGCKELKYYIEFEALDVLEADF